ncbi:MAG: peptidase M50 [Brevundimonas sp.]|nr:MAG: peptidase M50 [Brevundimonas sp.]
MTDTDSSRRPGPWDRKTEPAAPIEPGATPPPPANSPTAVAGQNPLALLGGSALLFGFAFLFTQNLVMAVAIVWGVLVHEYGHVLAMNRVGIGPATMHVTLFGGLAKARRLPDSEWHSVLVALAGPFFGLLAAIPFFALYLGTGGAEWLLGAVAIAALNLINLAPAPPLDGSRALGPVLARIHPMLERVAMVAVGVAVVWWGVATQQWFIVIFVAIAMVGHLKRGAWRPAGRDLTVREAFSSFGLFLLTAAACAAVAVAALMPLAEGSLQDALRIAGAYLGVRT